MKRNLTGRKVFFTGLALATALSAPPRQARASTTKQAQRVTIERMLLEAKKVPMQKNVAEKEQYWQGVRKSIIKVYFETLMKGRKEPLTEKEKKDGIKFIEELIRKERETNNFIEQLEKRFERKKDSDSIAPKKHGQNRKQ